MKAMRKCVSVLSLVLLAGIPCAKLIAQEAQFGLTVPVTITGGALDTGRAQAADPSAATFAMGFHFLAVPQLKLGSHWYLYSAVQVRSTPFFYQDAYSSDRQIDTDVLQAFVGYTQSWGKDSVSFRVGQLTSAFGAFPLRYDDSANPLIDQPLPYTYLELKNVRPGADSYGATPATLYGLPGAEADVSLGRLDARFQITNSNPYNPRSLFESGQHAQWTAGAGYTIRQGLRVGMSAYSGPWLSGSMATALPAGSSVRNFPARALGVDAQWARGAWNVSGEWDWFVWHHPPLVTAPELNFGYVELKRIISPRWYTAFRANAQANNYFASRFLVGRQAYEFAVGFRPNRYQLLKVDYEVQNVVNGTGDHDNVFGVQLVTSLGPLSKAFK